MVTKNEKIQKGYYFMKKIGNISNGIIHDLLYVPLTFTLYSQDLISNKNDCMVFHLH